MQSEMETTEMRKEMDAQKEKMRTLSTKNELLHAMIKKVEEKLAKSEQSMKILSKNQNKLKEEMEERRKKYRKTEDDAENYKTYIDDLKEQIEELKRGSEETEFNKIKAENEKLKLEMKRLQNENLKMVKNIGEMYEKQEKHNQYVTNIGLMLAQGGSSENSMLMGGEQPMWEVYDQPIHESEQTIPDLDIRCLTAEEEVQKQKDELKKATQLITQMSYKQKELKEQGWKKDSNKEGNNPKLEENYTCGVCGERHKEIIYINCGHVYYCGECYIHDKSKKCPICKRESGTMKCLF